MHVSADRHGIRVDGLRKLVRAGSLPYFRLPSKALWRDRLVKMREAGLNAVQLSYPWSYHSGAPGEYDFAGIRNVDELHDLIEEVGLYLIACPGPFIGADLDLGGLPAWLLRDPDLALRCRRREQFRYSLAFMAATRGWFSEIMPRFASRANLLLVQIENEYTIPAPFWGVPRDLWDLAVRWLGSSALQGILGPADGSRSWAGSSSELLRGRSNPYVKELCSLARGLGVTVPLVHSDLPGDNGRQLDVDLPALGRRPIATTDRDWRNDPGTFDGFCGDAGQLATVRSDAPLFYAQLQAGLRQGWSGRGYGRVRELFGVEAIDNATKAALAEGATLWCYVPFCGGTSWGYMGSPAVYSSYDCGAPVSEGGPPEAAYDAVRRLNDFLERFEEDLVRTEPLEPGPRGLWSAAHLVTRRGPTRRFVFLRNPTRETRAVPTREAERASLSPWETQIRVYDARGGLEAVSPELAARGSARAEPPPPLPRLESWTFSGACPQLDPDYDDSEWRALDPEEIERDRIDIDSLGLHYGFVWYRGTFSGPLDRLLLDARHCWAAWINRELVASGDQFQNRDGLGPDGARLQRISLRDVQFREDRNVVVIGVESLGHHEGFADDGTNPRGLVRIDTGATPIRWRSRGGLVRGERGMNPIVPFEGVERVASERVVLPHGWEGEPGGLALYETRFCFEGVDPKHAALALAFDPGRGKANLYLNGVLLGRYWPERGPQRQFPLPWGVLEANAENHLAIAVWKRTPRAALGKVRLEVL